MFPVYLWDPVLYNRVCIEMNIDKVIDTDPPNRQPSEKLKELMEQYRENEKNYNSNINHLIYLSNLNGWWKKKTKYQKYLSSMIKEQRIKKRSLLYLLEKELENDILWNK
ncbi:hypothetical protein M9Y10_017621 [Tritrichomonas musculus]|uniref:Uncharacterized protein n=1 Tax=Tritrichomonas musculus TaxID=1915356 RepID=A0ABR2HU21_9EUKA